MKIKLSFQATLESNKLDLAWTLLRKQRKDASVQKIDKKGRNLLHLLAIHSAKLWTQVVDKVGAIINLINVDFFCFVKLRVALLYY